MAARRRSGGIISSDKLRVLLAAWATWTCKRPTSVNTVAANGRRRHLLREQRQGAGGGFHHPHGRSAGSDMTVLHRHLGVEQGPAGQDGWRSDADAERRGPARAR